jgi:hypothetical protein
MCIYDVCVCVCVVDSYACIICVYDDRYIWCVCMCVCVEYICVYTKFIYTKVNKAIV